MLIYRIIGFFIEPDGISISHRLAVSPILWYPMMFTTFLLVHFFNYFSANLDGQ